MSYMVVITQTNGNSRQFFIDNLFDAEIAVKAARFADCSCDSTIELYEVNIENGK